MSHATYYNGIYTPGILATSFPSLAVDFYNYMKSLWRDGSPFTFGGNAYGGTIPSAFIYSGDPAANTGWTESTAGNVPGDRRLMVSSGPFNFPANSKIEWGYAFVFSQDTSQTVNTISQFNTRVVRDVKNARYYDETHQVPLCAPLVNVGIPQYAKETLQAMIYPNPGNGRVLIDLNEQVKTAEVILTDVFGREMLRSQINNGYRAAIDMAPFDKGIYYIEVLSGSKRTVSKFIRN